MQRPDGRPPAILDAEVIEPELIGPDSEEPEQLKVSEMEMLPPPSEDIDEQPPAEEEKKAEIEGWDID